MIDPSHLILRLSIAAILGSVVGLERERREWAAGLRDHMLVCLGAALFMIVSSFGFADALTSTRVVLDPSRVAAQVVSGIGFLGAGTILVRGEIIKGLTTAASLWAIAAVGLAAGAGLFLAAAVSTGLVLVILAGIKPLEKRLFPEKRTHELSLSCDYGHFDLHAIESVCTSLHADIIQLTVRKPTDPAIREIDLVVRKTKASDPGQLQMALHAIPGVHSVVDRRTLG